MSVMPRVVLVRSYASTSIECALSSRMRHGRSLCPSMMGCSFSTLSARAMFGSTGALCAVRQPVAIETNNNRWTAEDTEDTEDCNRAVGFLCALRVLCGDPVVVRTIYKVYVLDDRLDSTQTFGRTRAREPVEQQSEPDQSSCGDGHIQR